MSGIIGQVRPKRAGFSAPGKAFLAGGYLVLDSKYSAYVVALSARMHVVIEGQSSSKLDRTKVIASSPQFAEGRWCYDVLTANKDAGVQLIPTQGSNPFIEAVLSVVLSYLSPPQHQEINLTIFSDDAYHSQENDSVGHSTFTFHSRPISKVPKTGLGSSAALTTVLTAALLSFYRPELDLTSSAALQLVHNLAQLSHCTAQKKVGSGFDVASATYGSIVYSRFPPETIKSLSDSEHGAQFTQTIQQLAESKWQQTIEPCSLPQGIRLLMGDVQGGSETPKLVNTVLDWRKKQPLRALEVWTNLDNSNMALVNVLDELNSLQLRDNQEYQRQLTGFCEGETENDNLLFKLANCFRSIRTYLKIMTVESNAAIEPDTQSELLDTCSQIPGVIGGVVPGAGGYDAICLLVIASKVEQIKDTASDPNGPLANVKWLDLHEEKTGLKAEPVEKYSKYLEGL